MDTSLIIVTLVSLGVSVMLLVLNRRLIGEERRRSAARVEALIGAASTPVPDAAPVDVAPAPRAQVELTTRIVEPVEAAPLAVAELAASASWQVTRGSAESDVISSHELFHEASEPVSGFRRLALPASLGVIIVGVMLAGLVTWNHGRVKPAPPAAVAVAARNPASIPLELISLRHERTADGLVISGLVRNPATGPRMSDVNVIVFLFDRIGAFVTSVKRPLDFRTLAPGDESPFTIALTKTGTIGRYRVSFTTDDKVVPHVDRRQDPALVAAGFGGMVAGTR